MKVFFVTYQEKDFAGHVGGSVWDGECVLGHCGSPAGCEDSGCCRADASPQREWADYEQFEVK